MTEIWSITIQGQGPVPDLETKARSIVTDFEGMGVVVLNASLNRSEMTTLKQTMVPASGPPQPGTATTSTTDLKSKKPK